MDDTFDNEADTDNDDDGEEIPRVPRAAKNGAAKNGAAKSGAAAAEKGGGKKASSAKETERKKRELISLGKAKGFLTYDEVNEHMPENILSSELMDDWLSAFAGAGIELVEASVKEAPGETAEKGGAAGVEEEEDAGEAEGDEKRAAEPREATDETREAGEEAEDDKPEAEAPDEDRTDKDDRDEEEDAESYAKTNDPVRLYLRRMGSVALLSREGEVEISKRIEDGERQILQVVLNSSVAIEDILEL